MFFVLGIPGREETTLATLAALADRGGAGTLPPNHRTLVWHGETPPPHHPLWASQWIVGPPGGGRHDYWDTLMMAASMAPLIDDKCNGVVVLEDDVAPALGACLRMCAWQSPHVTTFYNGAGRAEGTFAPDDSFSGVCAVKYPLATLAKLAAINPDYYMRDGEGPHLQDFALSRALADMGELFYQHRSLVQHVGVHSMCNPKARLDGHRQAADFVDA